MMTTKRVFDSKTGDMTTTEHSWVWDSLRGNIDAYAKATDEMTNHLDLDPRNAMMALGRMGPFVRTCWEAETAQRILHGTEALVTRKGLRPDAALEQAIGQVVEEVRELLLGNRLAASSTSPASNTVDHYKAEAAAQWLQGIGSYTRVLASAKKGE